MVTTRRRENAAPVQAELTGFGPEGFTALWPEGPRRGSLAGRRLLLRSGEKVIGVKLPPGEQRYDIGNFEAYFRAFVEFALADERHGRELRTYLEQLLDVHHA